MKNSKFQTTDGYSKITRLLMSELDDVTIFKFCCFNDGIITYGYTDDDMYFEISIIADDTLLAEMELIDLLELKRVEYFDVAVYQQCGDGHKRINQESWNIKN